MTLPSLWIAKKRDGHALDAQEIASIVAAVADESMADSQVAALLMAGLLRGSTREETVAWTRAMRDSGRVLRRNCRPSIDKHSTGGVGDKVSLVLAPLAAACGAFVPMISGRGLGHTGGTIDKLESIQGLRTDLEVEDFERCVASVGFAMAGAGPWLAPADRRLYAIRDVTATVECVPWITASILSKKLAEGLDGLVLDIKCGRGAFMADIEAARELADSLVSVATLLGCKTEASITDMDVPLGRTIGNALEVQEAIDCLHGGGPADLRELSLVLVADMLVAGGLVADVEEGLLRAGRALDDGTALERFARFVEVQGGDPRVVDDPETVLPRHRAGLEVRSEARGYVVDIDPRTLALAALEAGAGRKRPGEAIDPAAGIVIEAPIGTEVERGTLLARVFGATAALDCATLQRAFVVGAEAPEPRRQVLERAGLSRGEDRATPGV